MKSGEVRIQTACLVILSFISIAGALYWLRPVMVPFILALFLQLILKLVIDLERKYLKIPKPIAIVATIIISIVVLVGASFLISSSVSQMITKVDAYRGNIQKLFAHVSTEMIPASWGIDVTAHIRSFSENLGNQVGSMIKETGSAILAVFSQGVIVFIFFLFLVIGNTRRHSASHKVWEQGEEKIKKYIGAKFTTSLVQGIMVGGVLYFFGIDLALMFGLFAFILNFIPSIGPIIASLLPIPIVLVTPDISLLRAIIAIALPGLIMFVMGNVVETKVVGDTLKLQPIAILMALIFWGMLWGITGMFLAVPLTAVLTLMLEQMEITRPIASLLASYPDEKKPS
jgi:AI-2 transport protein TqsA